MMRDVQDLFTYITGGIGSEKVDTATGAERQETSNTATADESSMLQSFYHALGSLLSEAPSAIHDQQEHHQSQHTVHQHQTASKHSGAQQPSAEQACRHDNAIEDEGSLSFWDFRAMMLTNCLPVTSRSPEPPNSLAASHASTARRTAAPAGEAESDTAAETPAGAVTSSFRIKVCRESSDNDTSSGCSDVHMGGSCGEPASGQLQVHQPGAVGADALKASSHLDTPSKQQQHVGAGHKGQPHPQSPMQQPTTNPGQAMAEAPAAGVSTPPSATTAAATSAAAAAAYDDVSDTAGSSISSSPGGNSSPAASVGTAGGAGSASGGGRGAGGSAGSAREAAQLRRALRRMAARMEELTHTCSQLQQENMRLRGAGADSDTEGDNLITDAVQQLLQEKSALQQKVSNLSRQNEALQELLEYTAAAATAASPSAANSDGSDGLSPLAHGSSDRSPGDGCGISGAGCSSAGVALMAVNPAFEPACQTAEGWGEINPQVFSGLSEAAAAAGAGAGGGDGQQGCYWQLVTPAASGSSSNSSPAASAVTGGGECGSNGGGCAGVGEALDDSDSSSCVRVEAPAVVLIENVARCSKAVAARLAAV